MCTCVKILLVDVANMNMNNILIIAEKILNLTNSMIGTSRYSAMFKVADHS